MTRPDPIHLPNLLAQELQISPSKARRLVEQGSVKLCGTYKDTTLFDVDVDPRHIEGRRIKVGKKRSFVVGDGGDD